jgi:dipeptidyl aminopeptidase/acylaminoacyl peptidase
MKTLLSLALSGALAGMIVGPAHAQARRPMTVDDLFNLQRLDDVRISPDGTLIAVVIQRAWSDPETFRPYSMFGNDHADIWILSADAGPARNITNGAKDGIGYWEPVWSPDGQRLALLSTAGGDNVRAYVWDRRSGRLQRPSERGVDLFAATDATGGGTFSPVQWVDERRLLVIVLPEGEQPLHFRVRRQTQRIASEAWKKAARGREPTSSILESGLPPGPDRAVQLLLIDVATGGTRILAEGGIRHVLLSPDREHVAVIAQARPPLPTVGGLRVDPWLAPSRLGIVALRDGSTARWIEGLINPVVDFGEHPHRWSPRGSALAVVASEGAVFVVSPTDRSVRRAARNLVASAVDWSGDEQLLVRARTPGQGERSDWWSISSVPAEPRNLTADLPAVPVQLVRTRRGHEMIGLADGVLWTFDLATGRTRPLIETAPPRVSALVWPGPEARLTASLSSMIVRVHEGDVDSLLRIELSSSGAEVSRFPEPAKSAMLAGYHPGRNLAVFARPEDPNGSFVWTGGRGSPSFAQRIALNEQLAGIEGGEPMLIDYRSTDGRQLKGLLLLPAGYQRGIRYPLVTWVYPGFIIRDITSERNWTIKNRPHQDNLHILAGKGYAVLIPSMPGARTRAEIPRDVLPAVDRVVELGIADAGRVAVAGQSGGGFVTYSLITQTNRFKAAIAISGPADNFTSYGVFSGEARYTGDVDEIVTGASEGHYGVPPWKDPDVYLRNSPIAFIDRVETPLLILHGDIDFVPIQHAEEVFTSLARLGKRVRFVRYWGESHGVSDSPANLRDRWQQIFRWLDTYLRDAR